MKKIFLTSFLFLFSLVVLTSSCKKKKDDSQPAPAPSPVKEAKLTLNGTTKTSASTSSESDMSTGVNFAQYVEFSTGNTFSVQFKNQPKASASYALTDSSETYIIIYEGNTGWKSTSGTLTVTVNGSYITSAFTNVTFSNVYTTNETTSGSGSITTKQ